METPAEIGTHAVWRTGDVVGVRFKGSITRSDIDIIREVMGAVLTELGTCFMLSDMSQCTGIDADARRHMTQWSKDHDAAVSGTAVYGFNFAMRTLISLTLNAIKFLGSQQVEVMFVKDEAEALRYVERKRAELLAEGSDVAS